MRTIIFFNQKIFHGKFNIRKANYKLLDRGNLAIDSKCGRTEH